MKNILYILAVATLCACNNAPSKTENTIVATPTGLQGIQNSASQTPATDNNAKSDLVFNPAHGQPGHDCSVAVGAPLNKNNAVASQPTTATTQTTTQTVANQPSTSQPIAATNTSGEKLNPAHGQPGHDCAVAVGAPLNSKGKSSPAITETKPPVAPQSQSIPNQSSEAKSNVKLNPAHGEPGHDCAKPVGAPLS